MTDGTFQMLLGHQDEDRFQWWMRKSGKRLWIRECFASCWFLLIPHIFDNFCSLHVNLTFLVRTQLKVYPELLSMPFSIPSRATEPTEPPLFFLEREAFSSLGNGHVRPCAIANQDTEMLVRICWNHHDAFLTPLDSLTVFELCDIKCSICT